MNDIEDIMIRAATVDDALCLGVLGAQVFLDTYAHGGIRASLAREVQAHFATEVCAAHLADPAQRLLVAERDAHLLGYVQIHLGATHEGLPPGTPCELFRLYVQEPSTRLGLGRRLLQAAEAAAAASGASLMWLTAYAQNRRALAFYAACGYADIGSAWYTFEAERHENRLLAKPLQPAPSR